MFTNTPENEASYMNALNQDNSNSSKLIEREIIQGSPMWAIGNVEEGYYIVLGKYRLTEKSETMADALKLLEIEKWNIIIRAIIAICNDTDQYQVRN